MNSDRDSAFGRIFSTIKSKDEQPRYRISQQQDGGMRDVVFGFLG